MAFELSRFADALGAAGVMAMAAYVRLADAEGWFIG
jgi:hypothetical protein